jgi:predicted nucleotidyltransferase
MSSSNGQPPLSPDQVLPLLREHQLVWRQRYHLQRIGLFGSTARNEAKAGSDVDVWVELDPLTPFATVHLKQELEALLQRPVDLVRLWEGVGASASMASTTQVGETESLIHAPPILVP